MYYDHTHWENKIREAAKQRGDNEILAMSSSEIQNVIHEIEKDYPVIRKYAWEKEAKHLNIYSKIQVCSSICNATKAILEAYTYALQNDWVKKYVFEFSKSCIVTYDSNLNKFFNAVFTIFDEDDITVEIDTYYMEISGYLSSQLITSVELDPDSAKILYEEAKQAWNSIKADKNISLLSSPDDDLMTINILPYLHV